MSVSGLLQPNNYEVNLSGRTLKSQDFTLTAAQVNAGTAITPLTATAGQLYAIDSVLCRLNFAGAVHTGAGLIQLTGPSLSTTILTNSDLVDNKNVVALTQVPGYQSVDAAQVASVTVNCTAASTGGGSVSGTIWYYEYSA